MLRIKLCDFRATLIDTWTVEDGRRQYGSRAAVESQFQPALYFLLKRLGSIDFAR